MKPLMIVGIVLILIGVVVFATQGFTYTKREKVLDIGPIEATAEHKKTIPISPIAGAAAVGAGIVLMIASAKSRSA